MGQSESFISDVRPNYVAIYAIKVSDGGGWGMMAETNDDRLSRLTNSPKNVKEWLEIEMEHRTEESWPGFKFHAIISEDPIDHDAIINHLNEQET